MIPEQINRRSIRDRLSARREQSSELIDSSIIPLLDGDSTTSTFRIDVTGELIVDEAASLATPMDSAQQLGELDLPTARAYHLLALPPEATGEDIEALAISVWNESGWINPGILHLTEGVTLEGPWSLSPQSTSELGIPANRSEIWLLRCPALRGAAPTAQLQQIDEWAQAFPTGMPVGIEHRALLVLRRIARRLAGALRLAGTGVVMTPDPESAVNLRVYAAEYLDRATMLHRLLEVFPDTTVPPGPADMGYGEPYALLVPAGRSAQIISGVRPTDQVPRALRWESWVRQSVYMYEINWSVPPGSQPDVLTRSARLERSRVTTVIEGVAYQLATALQQAAVIDEDDFLVGLDELHRAEAELPVNRL